MLLPCCIGEGYECHSETVVEHHHIGILPPPVHVEGSIDSMDIVSQLDAVDDSNVQRNGHVAVVSCKEKKTHNVGTS